MGRREGRRERGREGGGEEREAAIDLAGDAAGLKEGVLQVADLGLERRNQEGETRSRRRRKGSEKEGTAGGGKWIHCHFTCDADACIASFSLPPSLPPSLPLSPLSLPPACTRSA